MNPERWQQLDEIFHAALERGPAERASFLDEACAGDEALRKKIDALLAAHEEAGSFIEHPAFAVEAQSLAKAQTKGPEQSIVSQVIGRYRIIKPLGSGGMGEVYLAQDITLGRQVALKLLPAHFTADPERLHRFEQEARAASALNHSNIVTIHEIGNEGSFHFIAQEFVEGVTLSRHTRGPHLAMEEALEVIMQVASALAAAHAKGIVHRDIKPENIMVQERSHTARQLHVKVLDFGIAKLADVPGIAMKPEGTTRLLVRTEEGRAIGTPAYMSPEQARGESVDARTDIWSLGVVLYEVLTGKQPFTGETSQDVIASILRDDLPPLPSKSPEGLKWILKKALRKDREERYQTARELFSDLRELQEQLQANQSSARSAALSRSETAQDTQTRAAATEKPVVSTGETPARATSNSVNKAGRINRLGWGAGVGLLALLIAVAGITFGLYKLIGRKPTQTSQDQTKSSIPFQRMKMRKLTNTGWMTASNKAFG